MKVNLSSKYLNLIIFLLFVVIVFVLFGAIHNCSIENSAHLTTVYVFLFLLLILGLGWFLTTVKMKKDPKDIALANQPEQDTLKNTAIAMPAEQGEIHESKTEVDIVGLIPHGCKTVEEFSEKVLQNMAGEFQLLQGLMYLKYDGSDIFTSVAQFAYFSESRPQDFKTGETLPGQAVKNKTIVTLSDIPENYMTIASGLGKSGTRFLIFIPLIYHEEVIGLIEWATFSQPKEEMSKVLGIIADLVAETIVKFIKKVK
jgi:hypothetical protein